MKKVSILSLHLGYGGIEKCVVNLANILCERYEVEIAVCYNLYGESVFPVDPRVKICFLNGTLKPNREELNEVIHRKQLARAFKEGVKSLKVLYCRRKSVVDYIKNSDSDVIISTRDIFNEWLSTYGKEHVLKIGWEHNHYHENYKYANNISRGAKGLDYLILVSSELKKFYEKELRNSSCKCVFIPNSLESFPKKEASLKNNRLISVGRLSPEKGYLDLLKVYHLIYKDYPNWTLDIIGDGIEKKALEKYIKENQLPVTLHGFLGSHEISKLLDQSSIYIMTSHTESFGIVLIEAMSHGVPCVAFDSAEGAREIIHSGENGYLIHNRNKKAMVLKIESLMKNIEERKLIGSQARKSVQKYKSDIVGEKWFSVIEKRDKND